MGKIPKEILNDILLDPFYKRCVRAEFGDCGGRITFEHAIIYAGRQVSEKWAIIPLCSRHHSVNEYQDSGLLDKRFNEWIAINRMTPEIEARFPRFNWAQKRGYLNGIYGVPKMSTV